MNYKRIEINLDVVRDDEKVELGGNFTSFLIVKKDTNFEYKINTKSADTLYADELQGFQSEGVFHSLYVTHTAGTAGQKAVVVVF